MKINIVDTDCKYMCFKCSKKLFKTDKPVIFGLVYISFTQSTQNFQQPLSTFVFFVALIQELLKKMTILS